MRKQLEFVQSTIGVFVLLLIFSAATITTVGLSPTAITPQTAGIDTQAGELISNYIPLELVDLNSNRSNYKTQLIKLDNDVYRYSASIEKMVVGTYNYSFLRISNSNNVAVDIKLDAAVDELLAEKAHINISDGKNSLRVHTASDGSHRTVTFTVPANASLELSLEMIFLQNASFTSGFTLNIDAL